MTMLRGVAVALALLFCAMGEARAQVPIVARTVTTCGTLTTAYVAGTNNPVVQDINGQFCTNASGGGGGGAITMASGAVASGAYSSGSIALGAFASGSVSSGAFASGSLAAGSMVDLLTLRGTKAPGTAAANSILAGCVYTAAGVTLTDGQQAACQTTSAGATLVSVANATTAIGNNADGVAVSTGGNSPVVSYGTVYNGTTWDRMPGTTAGVTVRSPTAANFLVTLPAETTKVIGTVRVSAMAAAARNAPGCTVGTSSAQCLAAAQAVNFLQIQNTNATSTNNIACNIVGGTAVLNSATSIQLAPGQSASWGPNTGGVPSGAINCIATSASSPLYVEWN